jgi:hypothetical protein
VRPFLCLNASNNRSFGSSSAGKEAAKEMTTRSFLRASRCLDGGSWRGADGHASVDGLEHVPENISILVGMPL